MSAPLEEHIGYFADDIRLERYRAAVARVVRRGDLVVDVGCGSGVLGLICLQAGAAKVWGIDSTVILQAARETFARAGLSDRYVCVAEKSHRTSLPEKVDVAICDHVGFFGFDYGVVDTMQDARRRFLKPGGTLIPSRITLMLGLVQSSTCRKTADAWGLAPVPPEMHWLRHHGVNSKHAVKLTSADILGPPATLGTIDLAADNPDFFSFKAELTADRDGVVDGLGGWFNCELADGIWMTNSPLAADAINRSNVFLAIDRPLEVKRGEVLQATVMIRPGDSLIAWTLVAPASGRRFSHSTWNGMLMAPEDLVRSQPERVPRLSPAGLARRTVMGYCDGQRTAREIEQLVLRNHPDLLPSRAEISRFVISTLARDTE